MKTVSIFYNGKLPNFSLFMSMNGNGRVEWLSGLPPSIWNAGAGALLFAVF